MRTLLFHRVLLGDLERYEADGWAPAIQEYGAIGAVPVAGCTLAEVLVVKELDEEGA